MKNIKKFIKKKTVFIKCAAMIKANCLLASLMAHVPGGARSFCNAWKRVSDKDKIRVNEQEFTLLEACREVSKNGAESEILKIACQVDGARDARKLANYMRRLDTTYSMMGLLAMLEENEQLKKEES